MSIVKELGEITVPGIKDGYHISVDNFGNLAVSDGYGHLAQLDSTGYLIQMISTSGVSEGYHTVTKDGNLLFVDKPNHTINMADNTRQGARLITSGKWLQYMETGAWKPFSIYSSELNGDLLVGMSKFGEVRVTRYDNTGRQILQNIERDCNGENLFQLPHYLTENVNGDVCVSDYDKSAVIIVNRQGDLRFTYKGHRSSSEFHPYGICVDSDGHILVCDMENDSVHCLDQDGHFLSFVLTSEHGISGPSGLTIDNQSVLYLTQYNTNKVKMYKFNLDVQVQFRCTGSM
ncbi:tripartite motif-containing protein 2-like [Saccostrea cucullata]|uniref:tripartite motif-containing protein 2-like n=1 Tax=Saccostrea cuccullata TaxID=36930 RepID=UPI002ED195D0